MSETVTPKLSLCHNVAFNLVVYHPPPWGKAFITQEYVYPQIITFTPKFSLAP